MSKIAIISGSPTEQTRLNGVLTEIVRHLEGVDIIPEIIHVRNLPTCPGFNSSEF